MPKPIPVASQDIPVIGSTVKIKGITDQANQVYVNDRLMVVETDGTFSDEVIVPLGETVITIKVEDPQKQQKTYVKKIQAQENYFFLAGIADGTLNFSDSKRGLSLERDGKKLKDVFGTAENYISYVACRNACKESIEEEVFRHAVENVDNAQRPATYKRLSEFEGPEFVQWSQRL